MSTGTWAEVVKWARAQVEEGRDALEAATDQADITRIQARIAVMRELQAIPNQPKAPEMPPSPNY